MALNAILNWFPNFVKRMTLRVGESYADLRSDVTQGSVWIRVVFWLGLAYLILVIIVAIYWSREPEQLQFLDATAEFDVLDSPISAEITGSPTAGSLIAVANILLSKPGGYLSNDITPPGLMLDNLPNWEYGVLIQVRDLSKALREVFSRSQSQSTEDRDLVIAEPRFNFDNDSWLLPSTESVYREGIEKLNSYHSRLVDVNETRAQFYARADNLEFWLASVEKRLGSLSQRLSASVGKRRLNTDLAGEADAAQSTPAPKEVMVKTPWLEVDDIFYEARGAAWALVHFLKAVEVDFAAVLEKKNAKVSLQQIIRELEATQQSIYSPFILNGSGFGILANHSLVMASYISRAHAAIIDLRELLTQG